MVSDFKNHLYHALKTKANDINWSLFCPDEFGKKYLLIFRSLSFIMFHYEGERPAGSFAAILIAGGFR
jgi:hypothetical protein